jgi:DinB superfamily
MTARKATPRKAADPRRDPQAALREHVLALLTGGHAHVDFDTAVAGLPAALRNRAPAGLPHTPWRLIEHLRIAQWDILRFSTDATHVSPAWPGGYWPTGDATDASWRRSLRQVRADLQALRALVADPASDLLAPFPWGDGQTLLREALLVADHNAYHVGELVVVRRLLGAWKG